MFHKVKAVSALPDYHLSVQFSEGVTKIYDVKPLFAKWAPFTALKDAPERFTDVEVDVGGYGIIWNDDLDLSCDELWENGISEDKLIEELKLGEISGEEQGYIGIRESKSRLGL
jgi:hypothetical protein